MEPEILTLDELQSHVMKLTYKNSGFRLDAKKVAEFEAKIASGEIPSLPDRPEGAIALDTTMNCNYMTLMYMLTRTFGGVYGVDFGIWSDDGGKMYKRWIRVIPPTALATIYYERHILGMLIGQTIVNELGKTIVQGRTLQRYEVDNMWSEKTGQIGRRFAMGQRFLLMQLAESKQLTIEDIESFMYELELAQDMDPRPSDSIEGIEFREDWRESSFNVIREAYGDPDSDDVKELRRAFEELG